MYFIFRLNHTTHTVIYIKQIYINIFKTKNVFNISI